MNTAFWRKLRPLRSRRRCAAARLRSRRGRSAARRNSGHGETKAADAKTSRTCRSRSPPMATSSSTRLKVRDLGNLSPIDAERQLEDVGTARGVANFSIRGLGINSSIPSIDPTVGVFIDGVYLGINGGVVLDIFDLESIEVLRGPQGHPLRPQHDGRRGADQHQEAEPTNGKSNLFKGAVESGLRGTGTQLLRHGRRRRTAHRGRPTRLSLPAITTTTMAGSKTTSAGRSRTRSRSAARRCASARYRSRGPEPTRLRISVLRKRC